MTICYDCEKQLLKNSIKISRISGLSKAATEGITWEDYSKEGLSKILNEISQLADDFLEVYEKD